MLFLISAVQALVIAASTVPQVLACDPKLLSRQASDSGSEYPISIPGDDVPSDPATTGYFINHLCINVRNATKTIDWYNRAFGLRLMFRLQVSEHFSISYMGHSHGGRNGTGYQTSEEITRNKNNVEGLLEILSLEYPGWDLPAGIKMPNTFSHIGMVVPNITDTQVRLEAMGANIFKKFGEPFTIEGPFSDATGFTQAGDAISKEEIDTIMETLGPGNTPLMFVADPDGTIIEVQNQ
jgi:lactoylglutathione lyase